MKTQSSARLEFPSPAIRTGLEAAKDKKRIMPSVIKKPKTITKAIKPKKK